MQKIDARRREIMSVQGDEKAPMRSPRSWLKKRHTSEMHLMNVFLQVSVRTLSFFKSVSAMSDRDSSLQSGQSGGVSTLLK